MQFTFALWQNLLYDRNSVLILNKKGLQYQFCSSWPCQKPKNIILLPD